MRRASFALWAALCHRGGLERLHGKSYEENYAEGETICPTIYSVSAVGTPLCCAGYSARSTAYAGGRTGKATASRSVDYDIRSRTRKVWASVARVRDTRTTAATPGICRESLASPRTCSRSRRSTRPRWGAGVCDWDGRSYTNDVGKPGRTARPPHQIPPAFNISATSSGVGAATRSTTSLPDDVTSPTTVTAGLPAVRSPANRPTTAARTGNAVPDRRHGEVRRDRLPKGERSPQGPVGSRSSRRRSCSTSPI